jgi:hypothetical protein
MTETRFDEIRQEHEARIALVGVAEANRELYRALAQVEGELDYLKQRVLDMVQITDRRGVFLPPFRRRLIRGDATKTP